MMFYGLEASLLGSVHGIRSEKEMKQQGKSMVASLVGGAEGFMLCE
jgi:hypothetical protein